MTTAESKAVVCAWAMKHPLEREYHDKEWGKPVYDDQTLFEFITLEGAQAGLSWITILKRRADYRLAFKNYDIKVLAQHNESDVDTIIANYHIIKNRRKIASVFSNARATLLLQQEFGSLSEALWQFVDHQPVINQWRSMDEVPASTPQSLAMSRFLKKRGFKFVGATICYAFMQATGMVDDHLVSCPHKTARLSK